MARFEPGPPAAHSAAVDLSCAARLMARTTQQHRYQDALLQHPVMPAQRGDGQREARAGAATAFAAEKTGNGDRGSMMHQPGRHDRPCARKSHAAKGLPARSRDMSAVDTSPGHHVVARCVPPRWDWRVEFYAKVGLVCKVVVSELPTISDECRPFFLLVCPANRWASFR